MLEINLHEYFSKVINGDKEAFVYIYQTLKQPVFTVVYRIVQSKETAEDITQELFIKLFISPIDSSIKNPKAWIFQMARNLSIDALRKKQCIDIDEIQQFAGKDDLSDITVKLDLETAIGELSCTEREILSLHLNAELSFSEISRMTGLSLSAVYRQYRRSLKKLRELLGDGAL